MKTIIFLLLSLSLVSSGLAQPFVRGTNAINAGIGLGSSLGSFGYSSQTPALSVQYDRGIWDIGGPGVISLGGYMGYKSFKNSYESGSLNYRHSWKYTVIGVRAAYHYNGFDTDKLDLYGGTMLSYNILNYSYEDNGGQIDSSGSYGSTAGLSLFGGARYFFTDHLAAMAEAGYGISYFTVGLSLKF